MCQIGLNLRLSENVAAWEIAMLTLLAFPTLLTVSARAT